MTTSTCLAPAGATAARGPDRDSAFIGLFDAHQRVVFTTALRMSASWADAEDLTAETFLRAYRALATYDPARIDALQPRAWLLKILLNTWRNARRAAARRPGPAPLHGEARVEADPAAGVERQAERNETASELARLLAKLPERQRIAVVLRHVNDLSPADIAAVLGCPEGTARSHISRGLSRLRALLAAGAGADTGGMGE